MIGSLKQSTVLQRKGEGPDMAGRVGELEGSETPTLLFYFPRTGDPIALPGKEVMFFRAGRSPAIESEVRVERYAIPRSVFPLIRGRSPGNPEFRAAGFFEGSRKTTPPGFVFTRFTAVSPEALISPPIGVFPACGKSYGNLETGASSLVH